MFPALEQFVLRYLLSGDNRNYPVYPPNDKLPDFRAGDDYIDRHIKRELKRGKYTYNKEMQDGITGIRFIGQYPYGSIDYGFHAGTWEEFTARLESIEPFVYIGYDENDIPERHYNTLPIEYRYLEVERAKLDTVFPDRFIPTNTIIDKTICGSGATWLEIHSQRNSIIIEPNVPVIISKEQKHQHIIGIYGEDNEVQDIVERIEEQTGYVKIPMPPTV